MNIVFIFVAFFLGVIACVLGLVFASASSDADDLLSESLYVERVVSRLNEETLPEGMGTYPADKVWYVAMKKAVEIVRNGGKDREEMSDLISRAEVMNIIQEELSLRCGHDADIALFSVKKKVSELPTAFDTEKVIAELESEKIIHYGLHTEETDIMKIDDAIDIVKKGGVE